MKNNLFGNYKFVLNSITAIFDFRNKRFIIESDQEDETNNWIHDNIMSVCYKKFRSSNTSDRIKHTIREQFYVSEIIVELFKVGLKLKIEEDFLVGNSCLLCDKKAEYLCEACPIGVYCGQECQAKHWETHKNTCY